MSNIENIKKNVEKGKAKLIPGLVQEGLDAGDSPQGILDAMVEAMGIVGDKFSAGTIFVPEMLIAAKTMSKGVEVLKPHLAGDTSSSLGTCIIGTVEGDLHDIGKNLVAMMVESAGFNVIDLGVDVPPNGFIEAVQSNDDVKIVACSGLLSTTMPALKNTVGALKASGLGGVKVMVGGAPVTEEFAKEIGADGYASDAGGAAIMARQLVKTAS